MAILMGAGVGYLIGGTNLQTRTIITATRTVTTASIATNTVTNHLVLP